MRVSSRENWKFRRQRKDTYFARSTLVVHGGKKQKKIIIYDFLRVCVVVRKIHTFFLTSPVERGAVDGENPQKYCVLERWQKSLSTFPREMLSWPRKQIQREEKKEAKLEQKSKLKLKFLFIQSLCFFYHTHKTNILPSNLRSFTFSSSLLCVLNTWGSSHKRDWVEWMESFSLHISTAMACYCRCRLLSSSSHASIHFMNVKISYETHRRKSFIKLQLLFLFSFGSAAVDVNP